jgi:hypothetical protein
MSSKKPIDIYSKEEIEKRIKSVISDTLVKEHERANSLATRYKSLQEHVVNASKNCKTTAAQGETPDQTKDRLLKTLEKVDKSLSELNLADNAGFKPDTTSLSINPERDETPDNKENSIRIYKLDQNIKPFSGAPGESLAQWLFLINESFSIQKLTIDRTKLSLISSCLRGSALNLLIRYLKDENPTWNEFINLLKSNFEDTNLDFRLQSQFFHVKMENSFPKYLKRFQEIINQSPNLSCDSEVVLNRFIDGLTTEYAFKVRQTKCSTLNEVIAICNDFSYLSQVVKDNSPYESVNKIKRVNFSKASKNYRNNNISLQRKPQYSEFRYNKKPFKRFGLKAPNNSSNNWRNSETNSIANKQGNKPKKFTPTCYKCNKLGHLANKCKLGAKKVFSVSAFSLNDNSNNLLSTLGTINDIPITMTLDTAATTCVMAEKVAKANNFKLRKSDVLVKLANNETVNVLGVTEKLKIYVKGHACDLEMFVLPNNDFSVLLGLNWFNKMNVSVTPADRTITFGSETFSLDDSGSL